MAFLLVPASAGLAAGAALYYGVKRCQPRSLEPNHAPGVHEADLERERRAREEVKRQSRRASDADQLAALERQDGIQEMHLSAAMAEQRVWEAQRRLREIEEENRRKEEERRNYPLPNFLKNSLTSGKLNIAVTGTSGVGKSSFINFVRDMKPSDPGYAAVGVTESTMEPTPYQFPSSDYIWDLPGAGTTKFPISTYMKNMGIRYFDVVIILTADRFTEADLMLKKEMERWSVPHMCIRNKIDVAVEANFHEENEKAFKWWGCFTSVNKNRVKDKTVKNIKSHFLNVHNISEVYVISSWSRHKKDYEYSRLLQDLGSMIEAAREPTCLEPYTEFGMGGEGANASDVVVPGAVSPSDISPSASLSQAALSAVEPPGNHVEYFVPGLFALLCIVFLWIGLRKLHRFKKFARSLQEPLMRT